MRAALDDPRSTIASAAPELIRECLRRFGRVRVKAAGTSMLPAIRPADILVVLPPADIPVAVDDVVLYARGDRLFAHRVIDVVTGGGQVITRGDSHIHADAPVALTDLLGRVSAIERQGVIMPAASPSVLARLRGIAAAEMSSLIGRIRAH